MAIYTVKVKSRPRPTKTTIRRRLNGSMLQYAKAARKYLSQALNADGRQKAKSADVSADKLIFRGDADVEAKVSDLIDTLDEAISSKLKVITNK